MISVELFGVNQFIYFFLLKKFEAGRPCCYNQDMSQTADSLDLSQPRVGIKEIAQKAGVSVATVSMSLGDYPQISERTRQRIRLISRQMGYQPPRRSIRSRQKQSRHRAESVPGRIGFLLLGEYLEGRSNQGVLHALTMAALKHAIRTEVFCVQPLERIAAEHSAVLEFVSGVDGVILSGHVDAALLEELEAREIPHVLFGPALGDDQILPGLHGQLITPDAAAMAGAAVKTLLKEGHRRIACICGSADRGLWNDRWVRGYRHALCDAGIAPEEALAYIESGGVHFMAENAVEWMMRLSPPPAAFVFPGVTPAADFVAAMRMRGHEVPLDAIIAAGHDQSFTDYGLKGCRRIGCNFDQMIELLIRQLCQLYHRPMPSPTQLILPFKIMDPPSTKL
jgi:DNA-binding LacI/PurR family transcriptional regulator